MVLKVTVWSVFSILAHLCLCCSIDETFLNFVQTFHLTMNKIEHKQFPNTFDTFSKGSIKN